MTESCRTSDCVMREREEKRVSERQRERERERERESTCMLNEVLTYDFVMSHMGQSVMSHI